MSWEEQTFTRLARSCHFILAVCRLDRCILGRAHLVPWVSRSRRRGRLSQHLRTSMRPEAGWVACSRSHTTTCGRRCSTGPRGTQDIAGRMPLLAAGGSWLLGPTMPRLAGARAAAASQGCCSPTKGRPGPRGPHHSRCRAEWQKWKRQGCCLQSWESCQTGASFCGAGPGRGLCRMQ